MNRDIGKEVVEGLEEHKMKELADRIVALGVGKDVFEDRSLRYFEGLYLSNKEFVNDGRVVLALMEKCFALKFSWLIMQMPDERPIITMQLPIQGAGEYADPSAKRDWASQVVDKSLAVAICTACVEALEASK